MIDVSKLTDQQLFELHSNIEDELLGREIIGTRNNPTGDLAEHLFCKAFPRWKPADNSQKGFDAIGPAPDKLRYQIKGRRIAEPNGSRQLSAIRNLKEEHFDSLAGLLFNRDYSVYKAVLIPHAVLMGLDKDRRHIAFQEHTRSHVFLLVEDFWDKRWKAEGVRDVTAKLQSVWY